MLPFFPHGDEVVLGEIINNRQCWERWGAWRMP